MSGSATGWKKGRGRKRRRSLDDSEAMVRYALTYGTEKAARRYGFSDAGSAAAICRRHRQKLIEAGRSMPAGEFQRWRFPGDEAAAVCERYRREGFGFLVDELGMNHQHAGRIIRELFRERGEEVEKAVRYRREDDARQREVIAAAERWSIFRAKAGEVPVFDHSSVRGEV